MSFLLKAIAECLRGDASAYNTVSYASYAPLGKEKVNPTAQDIAADVVNALFTAEKKGRDLEAKINNIVTEYGWIEDIGIAILNALSDALKKGIAMASVIKEAFDKATKAVIDFAREHPVYCTLIALGILVLLMPWVIELLGFSELGPVEGSFASWWQSTYMGNVPKGSLFSFFQRLGMIWGRVLPMEATRLS